MYVYIKADLIEHIDRLEESGDGYREFDIYPDGSVEIDISVWVSSANADAYMKLLREHGRCFVYPLVCPNCESCAFMIYRHLNKQNKIVARRYCESCDSDELVENLEQYLVKWKPRWRWVNGH